MVYLRTAQLTALLVNFLLWESEKMTYVFFRGFSPDDLQQQRRGFQQDDRGISLGRENMFRPSGKSIFSKLTYKTLNGVCFSVAPPWINGCSVCTSAEEGVLWNAQQKLGHRIRQGGGGWDAHAVGAMWVVYSPNSLLTHTPSMAVRSTCSPANWMAGSWRRWTTA